MKNSVYIASSSQSVFPKETSELETKLVRNQTELKLIYGTNDFFCRDYMPIPCSDGTLVQFAFRPGYLLTKKCRKFITFLPEVYKANEWLGKYKIKHSAILLDGGNCVLSSKAALISDRVVIDNPQWSKKLLVDELSNLLKRRVILIPAYPEEVTGHADGMVRWISDKNVLSWNHKYEDKAWSLAMQAALRKAGLNLIQLPAVNRKEDSQNWVYLNYLENKNQLVMPVFKRKSDEVIRMFFEKIFKSKIEEVYSERILKHGGVLNCFTWNINL